MVKNNYIIILVLLIMIPISMGFEYEIEEITFCDGTIKIEDRSENVNNYNITDCEKKNNTLTCVCNPLPKKIILNFEHEDERTYDFIIEYYVGNDEENDKRTISYEGLKVKGKKEIKKITLPKIEKSMVIWIFVVLGIIGIIIIIAGIIVFKQIYKKQEPEESEGTVEVEKDIYDIVNRYK